MKQKKSLIILFTFILSINLFGQDSTYKNAIKFFVCPLPTPAFVAALNYERHIDLKNSLELTFKIFYHNINDIYYPSDNRCISIVPSYRHYMAPKKNNVLWLSTYSSIIFAKWENYDLTHFSSGSDIGNETDIGIGAVLGNRINWGKNKRMLLDIGLGGAYYFIRKNNPMFLPKLIFIIGRKF
ncbi:MAG TPA: hypothetical protein PKK00_00065 [Bacteroidales bacterium]|nr:hypothetical protein [Bacteroidales bacterium]HPS16289.1 hypothetical protein [Bacteroidales bacterium]